MHILGRNFLPELCGEVHPRTAPLQALRCALCSTEQSTFRGGRRAKMCREKGRKRGGEQRGQKGKKDAWKHTSYFCACFQGYFWRVFKNNLRNKITFGQKKASMRIAQENGQIVRESANRALVIVLYSKQALRLWNAFKWNVSEGPKMGLD